VAIETTVVIPAYKAWVTLPQVLDALAPQLGAENEAILVDSSPEVERPDDVDERWPWLKVVALGERALPGRARNVGASRAQGRLLAFLDADSVPEPAWLEQLVAAMRPEVDAVAGAVVNASPHSAVGTAGYILEFARWPPDGKANPGHGAGCNLMFRRGTFLASGGMPEDLWPGEDTAMTIPIARAGRLAFAPGASVRHHCRSDLAGYLEHQRRLGVAYGRLCLSGLQPHPILTLQPMLPAAFALRTLAVFSRLTLRPREFAAAARLTPLLLRGVAAWCSGLADARQAMAAEDSSVPTLTR
jgi:GT2 family glycosyltransferase